MSKRHLQTWDGKAWVTHGIVTADPFTVEVDGEVLGDDERAAWAKERPTALTANGRVRIDENPQLWLDSMSMRSYSRSRIITTEE